jgi:streptogramin lyase
MSDPAGARLPRWFATVATAAMAATAIVFTPLAAGAAVPLITEFPTLTSPSTPQGITLGSDGKLWFAEANGGGRIGQIDPKTEIVKEFPGFFGRPFWITTGSDGNLWITEQDVNKIGTMNISTGAMTEYLVPTDGSNPDQIAPGPDGGLWFTENHADKIGRIDPATHLFKEFPLSTGAGPSAIVAGPDGNVWFTEQSSSMIGRITPATSEIKEFPIPTAGSMPDGMAAGPNGNVWFAEYGAGKIGQITHDGVISEFAATTPASTPASIAAAPDGSLWFTEYLANKIGHMSPAGAMLAEFPLPTAGNPNGITTGPAGPDMTLWFTEPSANQVGRLTLGAAAAATALTYDGAATADFNDLATVSATLTDTSTPAIPLIGQTVVFTLNGTETCTGVTGDGVTDDKGRASCQLTPGETSASTPYIVKANFAGTATLQPSSTSASLAVTVEETALTLTAPPVIANGSPVTLNAVLTTDGLPLGGRTLTLGLGSGDSAQSCTAATDAAGTATCSIAVVNQPLGAGVLSASFAGDDRYAPASAGGAFVAYAFATGGMFVVGDGSAQVGGSVTFWSPTWSSSNTLSGGSGPASFKGFAPATTPATACAGTWTSTTGNSPNPPAGPLPAYMAVVVASSVDKSGSTVTGNITRIVIVKTDPGYAPDPGGIGTGTVAAVVCSA